MCSALVNNIGLLRTENYFVYIVTNYSKTTLYIGVTNNLKRRLIEHRNNAGNASSFAGKYRCFYLLYWERFIRMTHAIDREKQIKKWNRKKKEELIKEMNPYFKFLNEDVFY